MQIHELASGLEFPEGPVWTPDGSIVLVEIKGGRVTRVAPDGSKRTIATTGGGPNGAAIGPDGKLYVCNNGGFEWHDVGGLTLPGEQPADYSGGRIERIDLATGAVEVSHQLQRQRLRGPTISFDTHGFGSPTTEDARAGDRGGLMGQGGPGDSRSRLPARFAQRRRPLAGRAARVRRRDMDRSRVVVGGRGAG
jgi:gluconolactonase